MDDGRVSARAMMMILSKAVSHLCFLLIAVVLARSLERSDFGTFNQVWLVNRSLIYLFALGLPVSVYYFLPRLPETKRKGFILQTMFNLTVMAVPFSIIMYSMANTLSSYFHNPDLAQYLRLFAIYPLLTLPTVSTDAILISLGRTGNAALFEVVTKLTMIAAVAAAAFVGNSLDLVFKALLLYGAVQSVLGIWMVWRPLRGVGFSFSFREWQSQIAYAAPYGFSTIAGILNTQVDKVLIALFHPPAVFAVYAAGAFEIPLAGVTAVPVLSVTMPEFSKRFTSGDIVGLLTLWHRSMLKLAVPVFGVTGFLMVFAQPIVTGLFSMQYAASVWPFRIYLLFLPMRITVLDQVLASLGRTTFIFKSQVGALMVNIVLGYVFIRTLGFFGPALAALVSGYLFATLVVCAIRKRLNVSWSDLMPWAAVGRVALVSVLAGAASLPLLLVQVGPIWKLAAGSAVYGVIYLIGNVKTRSITAGDLRVLRGWVGAACRAGSR